MKQLRRFSLPHFFRPVLFASLFLVTFLFSGCNIPFTDKVVTLPFFEKKPKIALTRMTEKMLTLDTAHSEVDLQTQVNAATQRLNSDMHVTLVGDFDASAAEGAKSTMVLNYTTSLRGFQITVQADSVTIGDNVYLRFTELPSLGIFGLPDLTDQWFMVTPETLADSSLLSFTDALPFGLSVSPASLYGNVTPEQKQQLNAVAQTTAFFRFEERLPDEKVGDANTYHYRVSIDQVALQDFVTEAAIILQDITEEAAPAEEAPTADENADEEANADTLLDTLQNIQVNNLELWIGKKDFYLRKAAVDFTFQSDVAKTGATDGAAQGLPEIDTHADATFLFSNFGQQVDIVAPSDAETFEDFLKQRFSVLGGLGGL